MHHDLYFAIPTSMFLIWNIVRVLTYISRSSSCFRPAPMYEAIVFFRGCWFIKNGAFLLSCCSKETMAFPSRCSGSTSGERGPDLTSGGREPAHLGSASPLSPFTANENENDRSESALPRHDRNARLAHIDIAKGIAIMAIVAILIPLPMQHGGKLVNALLSFSMPLLFICPGMPTRICRSIGASALARTHSLMVLYSTTTVAIALVDRIMSGSRWR
ncbi:MULTISPECIES: hypothetical protein [unclassified Caballeronia]|uniref:hypothetical protein n=1 Tax=unclassified Caballeronia TaxID=2646786 RepID=UPI002028EAFE|nr:MULTISPECIES: hypothetical protein [unclassified Caballeronia]